MDIAATETFETPNGLRFPRNPDFIDRRTERALKSEGYEDKETRAVIQLLRRDDRVLELGSGIGYMSTLMARRRPLEAIETYEANPRLLPFIRQVHALNDRSEIEARNAVLSDGGGDAVPFYIRRDFLASSLCREDDPDTIEEVVQVPQMDIQEVTARLKPTFLVCDIEGAEASLLPAADLSHLRAAVVELHPQWIGQAGVQAVFDAFHRAGLTYFPKVSHAKVVCFKKGF
ncbi:methyltransferase, FkbM family [Roseivivax lentus]|uniref:Methyltransferase, FkbM family n=1 Tax=Roseivivax lentus TaxID=633194 RepID=A0A1N7MYF0_9RHOB|nr:FkbM family methyltransferase [Roseivivax lentus]SIS91102.1 methyltransferase, FkbM family [Roseivivax lentus]